MRVRVSFLNNKLPDSLFYFIKIIKKHSKLSIEKTHELILPLYLGKSNIIFNIPNNNFDNLKNELNTLNINIEKCESEDLNIYLNLLLNDIGFEKTNNLKEICETMAYLITDMKEKFPNINWQTIKETIEKYK